MQGGRGIEERPCSSADTLLSCHHTGKAHHHVYIPKHDYTHIPLVSKKEERYTLFVLHIHCHLHDRGLKLQTNSMIAIPSHGTIATFNYASHIFHLVAQFSVFEFLFKIANLTRIMM